METVDAVVIGSGPNGLVAANLLADAGWEVVVLEAQPEIGGAVHSDSAVRGGYVHDTFSSFYPLAAASPVLERLQLEEHGLEWVHAPAVVGTPFTDGTWAVLHRDVEGTATALENLHPGDGDAWMAMYRQWEVIGDQVMGALLSPFPPIRHGLAAATKLPVVGGMSFLRMLTAPVRTLAGQHFGGRAAHMLLAGNAAHADIAMDAPGSGLMGWLLAMLGQQRGFPVPRGGAGMLAAALARRFRARGGSIRTGSRVAEIFLAHDRAVGVRTHGGEVVGVRQAVVANVAAPALYGNLVPWDALPTRWRRQMKRFEWDPGTVKVDWALDRPVPWSTAPEPAPAAVHLADSVGDISLVQSQISSENVPARPFVLMGQMAVADPSRVPDGGESVWAYTHVPQQFTGDAGDGGISGRWDGDDCQRMADRMQARIEEHAPGFGDRVVARRVLGPRDLEARDPNLVNGAINGGTANLQQQLIFRPVPGLGRAETPVTGLYLGSASAHPGGGVHGACGANAARAALAHARMHRLTRLPVGNRREVEPTRSTT